MITKGDVLVNLEKKEKLTNKVAELERMIELFAYSTSHDLKAPLSTLSGLIKLLRKEGVKEGTEIYLQMMDKIILQQEFFLHNITDLLKNARTDINPKAVDFEAILYESFAQFNYLSHVKNIDKHISVKGKVRFLSDSIRVKVILHNLISNAIRFQNESINNHFVKVSVKVDVDKAEIKIEDNGVGIEAIYLDKIFNIFFRATESHTGNGLGLYITKEMIHKLNGDISIKSEINLGTSVIVTLPNYLSIK